MTESRENISELAKHYDRKRLRTLLAQAKRGVILKERQRFDAALELGKRYNSIIRGQRRGRVFFEGRVIEILNGYGHKTETFDVAKWKMPKGVDQIDAAVRSNPKYRSLPQRSMIHYLAAIQALAEFGEEDVEDAQVSFLQAARLWKDAPIPDAAEDNWDAAGQLHRMLDAVCRGVGAQTGLMDVFRKIYSMPLTWRYLDQTLIFGGAFSEFTGDFCPLERSPLYDVYISESFPFPSVPLVRIPLAWGELSVEIEEGEGSYAAEPGAARPDGAFVRYDARVIQYRDIHLAIAPLNKRQVGPVLMSRGLVGLRIPPSRGPLLPVFGTLHWLENPQVRVQPEILFDGGWRRLKMDFVDDVDKLTHIIDGPGNDTEWESDPVEYPGLLCSGANYVVYNRMSIDHIHYWLFNEHALDAERSMCPWSLSEWNLSERPRLISPPTAQRGGDMYYDKDGRPFPLLCPVNSSAFHVEATLYNGGLHKALLDQATILRQQVNILFEKRQAEGIAAQDELISMWQFDETRNHTTNDE